MIPDTSDLINKIQDTQDKSINGDVVECPVCITPMLHFSGVEHIPEHFYCPYCMDTGWDYDINFTLAKVLILI